jgi:hypothetical protein
MAKKKTNLSLADIQKDFIKIYSEEEWNQIVSSDESSLKRYVAECEANKTRTYTEVFNSEDWLKADDLIAKASEIQKPLKDALKEMDKRQSIKETLCLKLLHKKGIVNLGLIEDSED